MGSMDSYGDDGCVTFLVRHAWLSMRSVLAEALEEHGLSVQQYGTLLCVRKDPGLTIADVGRVVGTTRQSANELITGMERAGLIERRPNPKDRRTQQVHLTDAGARRLDEATPAIRKVEDELEASFTAADRSAARAWLAHMVTAVEG
ncbi:DNA-binding MarR family transcriptional regulator [Kribbella rubisoli]|uniref:DNA-binding MarR family transcriptional regulator n=2 Tax=Kribbella rubisoli TaxID=3075929 RepID=A0A4Q7XAF5_9ACTN|nr:DNA-binding MarR family transcriptional regulator [Kribbella rubisoli]